MTVAAQNETKLVGQRLVEVFMDELKSLLQQRKSRRIRGTKQEIVNKVIASSPLLTDCNADNLMRQLRLMLDAPCRRDFGLRYTVNGDRYTVVSR